MFQYDFSNHQNRHIKIQDMPEEYYKRILKTAKEDPFYPLWHIAPECGLLNDPNGLCQVNGEHHIFHQWFPAGPVHGLKYWRHIKTRDFRNYKDMGIGMCPENPFDNSGCYTGMALKDKGKIHIYYTGVEGEQKIPHTCHGLFNGETITDRKDILSVNPDVTTNDYRDPYVWKKGDWYFMLVGGQSPEKKGILLLYRGKTPEHFKYAGNLDLGNYPFGYMLECPNYYEQKKKGILFFSPMGIPSFNKYDFKNVFSVVYAVGDPINIESSKFSYVNVREMDKGFDFYAPQSYEDEKGRRILFAWLGNSKNPYPTDKNNWSHMLTMPRVLSCDGDYLVQTPLEELKSARKAGKDIRSIQKVEECSFEMVCYTEGSFSIEIFNDIGENIRFFATQKEYCLDRSNMTYVYAENFGTVRYARRLEGKQIFRVFADRSSLELFCDNGKTVFTTRMFLENISGIKTEGIKGTWYDLESIRWN